MGKNSLQIQQLNTKMLAYASLQKVAPPPTGWIKAIRNAIGMSMLQLGNRLSITKQSVQDMERREKDGSITIKALREAARALDMPLVYGFVPNDGSLELLIERKAKAVIDYFQRLAVQKRAVEIDVRRRRHADGGDEHRYIR